jgi:hypothetical protein
MGPPQTADSMLVLPARRGGPQVGVVMLGGWYGGIVGPGHVVGLERVGQDVPGAGRHGGTGLGGCTKGDPGPR